MNDHSVQGKMESSVLNLIGNTPMVRLDRIASGLDSEILCKLEYLNPSGSTKDRIALRMIESAERQGLLRPGYTIVEASSGNTGIALSFVAAVKGYKMIVFMPDTVASAERTAMMEAYGAQIRFVDLEDEGRSLDAGVHGALSEIVPRMKCRELEASRPDVWWARQFSNPDNVGAHRETTGREILRQTNGTVDAIVASIGTGGTLMGVAQALREAIPQFETIAVEPAEDPVLGRGRDGLPIIEGITDGIALEILDDELADKVILVSDHDAIATAHLLAEKEGLFCGVSSGANVFAAMKLADRLDAGKTIVAIMPDSRDRYLSTERYIT